MSRHKLDCAELKTIRPRWWPAVVFLALTAGAMVWVRFFWDVHTQDKNIWTYLLCGVFFFCLLLWLLVLSRFSWRRRTQILAVVVLLHGIVFATVRIKGVDGDLVPILEWRWASRSPYNAESAGDTQALIGSNETNRIGGWAQFLGPSRNCVAARATLETDWVQFPPTEIWRTPVGTGWSGFAVTEGYAVTQEQEGENETIIAFDAQSGGRLWSYSYPARYSTTIAGEGPRATPAIVDGLVYAVGSTGWLSCLELATGHLVWRRNPIQENGAVIPEWGYSVSPLVISNKVILSVGATNGHSLMAFHRITGEPLWAAGDDRASYSSPVLFKLGGKPQVVVFDYSSITGHDPEDGRILWSSPYSSGHVHVAVPIAIGVDHVLFSSGYGHGSELYSLLQQEDGQWETQLVWKSRRMKAKFANLIEYDGFIYGLDDGILACISATDGTLQWKDGRYGHGQVIRAGTHLLITSEVGELVLIELNPQQLNELATMKVFEGKMWNPPALAGEYLFLRTDQEAVCLRLALRQGIM